MYTNRHRATMHTAPPRAKINVPRNHSHRIFLRNSRRILLRTSLPFSMATPSAPPHSAHLLLLCRTCLLHGKNPKAATIMPLTHYSRLRRPVLKVLGIRSRRNQCPRSTAPLRLHPLQHRT